MQKIINFDDVTGENREKPNPNWPQLPEHPYKKMNDWRPCIKKNKSNKPSMISF